MTLMRETGAGVVRLLLVEDNAGDARLLCELLGDADPTAFQVTPVARLSAALDHLAGQEVDLALLDLGLPDSQGLGTLTGLRRRHPALPVIVLTGLDDETVGLQAVQAGAQDYLVKGRFDQGSLLRAMRYAIERQQLVTLVQASEGRLQRIIRDNADGILVVDEEGSVCFVNPAAEALFGRSASALVGSPFGLPCVAGDSAELDVPHTRGDVASLEMRTVDIDWEGQKAVLVSLRDVTERVQAREVLEHLNATLEALVAARTAEIRDEQERTRAILRSVGEAIAVTDLELRIAYTNDAFTALTGYTAEEALGIPVGKLLAERMSAEDWEALRDAVDRGRVWHGEAIGLRQDGRTYDVAFTIAPLRDADGQLKGYVTGSRDITRLKELDRARRRFIVNISHQLRTPATVLKLYAYLARNGAGADKTKRYLEVLENKADWMCHLVEDILEIAALDSGQAVTVWETVSLATLVDDVVRSYQGRAQASGLSLLGTREPAERPPLVQGDPDRLTRALGELVENALLYTPRGGQVTVALETIEEMAKRWVTVAVCDTGPGIPPEDHGRVFDRFYRGELADPGHIQGTGLGLAIAREIVDAHGGRLWVESEPGKGATFCMTLLLHGEEESAIAGPGVNAREAEIDVASPYPTSLARPL